MVAPHTLAFAPLLLQESGSGDIVSAVMGILSNPLSVVTILIGSVVLAFSIGLFAYLTLGAVGDAFTGATAIDDRKPPRRD